MTADQARQGESTPLLQASPSSPPETYSSLVRARRRSSAFLSFLSEPEFSEEAEHEDARRSRTISLLVCLSVVYYAGVMVLNSFSIEEIKTLSCAEYYYPSTANREDHPRPLGGDPMRLCAVPFVDKRTSEMMSYTDTLSSFTGCIGSLLIAKYVLPKLSRRTAALTSVAISIVYLVALSMVPTHYSLDPTVSSTSSMHPTNAQYLFVAIFTFANLLGSPQNMFPILMQVMVVDVCKEDEKASSFSKILAGNLIGATVASFLLLVLFPYFGIHFSILYHTGPCSPFLVAAVLMTLTLILVAWLLPETKPSSASHQGGPSETAALLRDSTDERRDRDQGTVSDDNSKYPSGLSWLRPVIDTMSLFGYLLPYRSSSDGKWDYKLSVMLIALLFGDTLTVAWSNLIVFASSHLDFGPEDVAIFLGALGGSKGLYNLFGLPLVVKHIRKIVKGRIRDEILAGETPVINKRERYVVETDRIVAMVSLAFDVLGWLCMGLAAKQLSVLSIYGSLAVLLFATGAIPSIQALALDLFQAQNRPTLDPVAERDAFITLFVVFVNVTSTIGPVINNAIYNWSIDHNMNFLLFFTVAGSSLISLLLVASVGSVFK